MKPTNIDELMFRYTPTTYTRLKSEEKNNFFKTDTVQFFFV